jgi:biotin-(acetyl-CoA carboxylase) ligase
MKLKNLTLAIITISSLSFAELVQPKVIQEPFTPEIKIINNLTTILPQIGARLEDKGENISSYIVDKISKGKIHLNNHVNINLCGEITYILGIGINKYKHGNNLHYAISDAEKIVNKVENTCKKTRTYLLKNSSKEKILQTLENIAKKITKKDSIVFTFSGHGVRVKDKDYLLTSEIKTYNPTKLIYSALTLESIEEDIKSMHPKSAVMIIDAERVNLFYTK